MGIRNTGVRGRYNGLVIVIVILLQCGFINMEFHLVGTESRNFVITKFRIKSEFRYNEFRFCYLYNERIYQAKFFCLPMNSAVETNFAVSIFRSLSSLILINPVMTKFQRINFSTSSESLKCGSTQTC